MVSRHYILNTLFKAQTKFNLAQHFRYSYLCLRLRSLGSVTRIFVGFDIYIPVERCGGVAGVRSLLRALCSGCLNE